MCLKKLKKYSYEEMRSAVRFAERATAKLILSNINDVIPSTPPRMLTCVEQDVLNKINDYACFYNVNIKTQGGIYERKSQTSSDGTEREE